VQKGPLPTEEFKTLTSCAGSPVAPLTVRAPRYPERHGIPNATVSNTRRRAHRLPVWSDGCGEQCEISRATERSFDGRTAANMLQEVLVHLRSALRPRRKPCVSRHNGPSRRM
jgi:hypothetical protein